MWASDVAAQHQQHWDEVYGEQTTTLAWYQPHAAVSVELIGALGVAPEAAVVDVGGGASHLVDDLLGAGFTDVSVLDLSRGALGAARRRLGPAAANVKWLHQDLLAWEPARAYDVWHDRAVFHFLLHESDRARYRRVLRSALAPDGQVVIATFAPDGPTRCSGLPVARYGTDDLLAALGGGFELLQTRTEQHVTPSGVVQPFTWVAARPADRPRA